MEAQRFPGLHISMCIAHGHVQPVVRPFHEEPSFLLAYNSREDWLQRERQGAGKNNSGQVADSRIHRSR